MDLMDLHLIISLFVMSSSKDHKVSIDQDLQVGVTLDEYEAFCQLNDQFTPERRKALLRKIE